MDAKELFKRCLRFATEAVNKVTAQDFSRPTPDTEWDVRALANHMLNELSWVSEIVEGKTVAEVGSKYDGDLVADDLTANWQAAATKTKQAVKQCDLKAMAHLSYSDATNDYYLGEIASDLLIHGWDLSAALELDAKFDPAVAQEIYNIAKPKLDKWSGSSMFAKPLKVPAAADIQTKLLALFGRDVNWLP